MGVCGFVLDLVWRNGLCAFLIWFGEREPLENERMKEKVETEQGNRVSKT